MEYAWFNNVETKPGIGYPKEWENQTKWNGGWTRKDSGSIEPRQGGKLSLQDPVERHLPWFAPAPATGPVSAEHAKITPAPRMVTARKIIAVNLAAAVLVLGLAVSRLVSSAHIHDRIVIREARAAGVDPRLVSAVIWKESRYRSDARGTAGEVVRVEVLRQGQRLEVDVPRGPLGVRIAASQGSPGEG
jgi:hypothetical protein